MCRMLQQLRLEVRETGIVVGGPAAAIGPGVRVRPIN